MVKKGSTLITVVNNGEVYFVVFDQHGEMRILHSLSLDQFLNALPESGAIPEAVKIRNNALLIVSDYWFGNTTYRFQSKKRALADAFAERKLLADHPDLPDIRYFFDYVFDKTEEGEQGLYIYFPQEPAFFQLYKQLVHFKLSPLQITTPAFLWEQKLKKLAPDFHEGGKGIVHLLPSECFLYFFSRGRFLFSRSITIPEYQDKASEIFSVLAYEINQSNYLFSQKAKAEIDRFYLVSPTQRKVQELSELLGKEIRDLSSPDQSLQPSPEIEKSLGPVGVFDIDDLSPSGKFLGISHRQLKTELKWKPVQTMGMAIGLILLLLLAAEALFLWKWFQQNQTPMTKALTVAETEPEEKIQQFNEALDQLLADTAHPSPSEVTIKIARSLPDNAWIREMTIDIGTNLGVDLQGIIQASGPDQFRNSLSAFISNLNNNIRGPRPISMQDIDIRLDEGCIDQKYQDYLITFRFDLP